jgi:hypothetical protein
MTCAYLSCSDPSTATVLVGAVRLPVCFTHEREYSDRYGPTDIHSLHSTTPRLWPPRGGLAGGPVSLRALGGYAA